MPPTTRRNTGPTEIRPNFSQVSSAATGQVASEEPRPISTSRQPVLPRSVSSSPSSKNSIQPPLRPSSAAAIEADDFRAPEAAGETDQEDRAIPQAPEIAEIERGDHGEEILGQDRLLLLGRAALGAADPRQHGGDVPVLAVDRLAALGEIPLERREPPLDGADRARLRAGRAGGAGGDVEAENLRIRGQGGEVLPARPGGVMAPVGGVGAVGVWRRGGAGVVAGGLGERGEARGQGGGAGSTAGGAGGLLDAAPDVGQGEIARP